MRKRSDDAQTEVFGTDGVQLLRYDRLIETRQTAIGTHPATSVMDSFFEISRSRSRNIRRCCIRLS